LFLLLSACAPKPNPPQEPLGPSVRIITIDVGQGDALLIIGTDGTVVLFDGGGLDAVEPVRMAIQQHTAGRVDHVVVSHFHADHMAGLAEYLLGADGRVGTSDDGAPDATLWDHGADQECGSLTCDRYRAARGTRGRAMIPLDEIPLGEASLRCVAANGAVSGATRVVPTDENARSIALLLTLGDFRALLGGDLTGGGDGTANVETSVAAATGPVDLLKINHHGSRTSTNLTALQRWLPRAAVISLGTNNTYCHPAPEVLQRLDGTGTRIFATGSGVMLADSDCPTVTAWPAGASFGLGTVEAVAYGNRDLFIAGEEVP